MILPPKRPDTLTKMELANIVRSLQAALFLSEDERPPHREFWTDGNVMEGADFVSYVPWTYSIGVSAQASFRGFFTQGVSSSIRAGGTAVVF